MLSYIVREKFVRIKCKLGQLGHLLEAIMVYADAKKVHPAKKLTRLWDFLKFPFPWLAAPGSPVSLSIATIGEKLAGII